MSKRKTPKEDRNTDKTSEKEQKDEEEALTADDGEGQDGGEECEEEEQALDPLTQAQREADDYKDRWVRLAAEFDNYKKRTMREMQSMIQSANDGLIRDLLPIVDGVDRALAHSDEDSDSDGFREGIRMVMEELPKSLKSRGLEEIDALGKPFDPNDHEALMQAASDEYDAGLVAEVVEKGYRLGTKVLRHAKVVVSKGNSAEDSQTEPESADKEK